jgi:hypothetical protein
MIIVKKELLRDMNIINFLCVDNNNDNMRIPVAFKFKPEIKDEIYKNSKLN